MSDINNDYVNYIHIEEQENWEQKYYNLLKKANGDNSFWQTVIKRIKTASEKIINELKCSLTVAENEYYSLKRKNKFFKSEIKFLEDGINFLSAQNDSLTAQNASLSAKNSSFLTRNSSLSEQVDDLLTRNASLEQKMFYCQVVIFLLLLLVMVLLS